MIIVDTSYWLALANRRDHYHSLTVAKTAEISEPLITTWPVITETCHLLLNRMGSLAQARFVNQIANFSEIFNLEQTQIKRCAELMEQYQNLPMDLADASLVILAESLGDGRILTTDQRDFNAYRWKNQHPFTNLLLGEA